LKSFLNIYYNSIINELNYQIQMGVPSFFRQIIQKYPRTQFANPSLTVNHFCIDFNSIIYDTFNSSIFKNKILETSGLTTTKLENNLIKHIISNVANLVNNVVRPNKSIYIAIDGPVPRAKMIQQRARRFKTIIEKEIKREIEAKYPKVELTENQEILRNWNPSQNASPGTKFMKKLSNELRKSIQKGDLSKNNPLDIVFSDCFVPGEGEHKYIPFIKSLETGENQEDSVVLSSPDADVIMISALQKKNNLYILRKVDKTVLRTNPEYEKIPYLYISNDSLKQAFFDITLETLHAMGANTIVNNLTSPPTVANGEKKVSYSKETIVRDYIFLLFLAGNDFISPIPFLKLQNGGMDTILRVYSQTFPKMAEPLIQFHPTTKLPQINIDFFYQIMNELGLMEDRLMKIFSNKVQNERRKQTFRTNEEENAGKTPMEIEWTLYENAYFYSPQHPDFKKYNPYFDIIRYNEPKHVWKSAYYQHHFHMNPENTQDFNKNRSNICYEYIRALNFTLQYYLLGVPSWSWYYPYHNSPVPSDLAFNLHQLKSKMTEYNHLSHFEPTEPYKPFEQLMLILPTTAMDILPKSYQTLFKDEETATQLMPYYPTSFELDIITGGKYIYAEPILPDLPANVVLTAIRGLKKKLTAEEKTRNEVKEEANTFHV
jgi:5'-3' exonuclease